MAVLGQSNNIIVGAAQVFISKKKDAAPKDGGGPLEYKTGIGASASYGFSGVTATDSVPAFVANEQYEQTLESASAVYWRNVGYTNNGLEIQFQPDFGEVKVDQLLDVARMFKQGMKVNLVTSFAEATLENLLVATASSVDDLFGTKLNLQSGNLGEVPLERALIAVGPGSGNPSATGTSAVERIYMALRVLSIENVNVTAKRDAATMFDVTFRLMPASNGSYGKIVDRTVSATGSINA